MEVLSGLTFLVRLTNSAPDEPVQASARTRVSDRGYGIRRMYLIFNRQCDTVVLHE